MGANRKLAIIECGPKPKKDDSRFIFGRYKIEVLIVVS